MPSHIHIDVELFAASPDIAGLQQEVEQALDGIWPALGLPAEPVVTVREGGNTKDIFDFTLHFDGRWAPAPVFGAKLPLPLAQRIVRAIFARRSHLLSEDVLRHLREELLYQHTNEAPLYSAPLPVWRRLACLLLENGFSLDRLPDFAEHWTPGKSEAQALEELVSDPETLAVVVYLSPEGVVGAEAAGWNSLFEDLYQQTYQNHGILLPRIRIETTTDRHTADQFRLRLNDLFLPVGPLNAADPLDQLREWVVRLAPWFINAGLLDSLLDDLEESNRALVIMTREQWPVHRLCAVQRLLLREGVSVRNLPEILDVLLRIEGRVALDEARLIALSTPTSHVIPVAPGAADAPLSDTQLAGQVRVGLKHAVVFPRMTNGIIQGYTFEPDLLRDFRDGFFQNAEPKPGTAFRALLEAVVRQIQADAPAPVFLVPTGIRPEVYDTLQPYLPDMAVLSYDESPSFFRMEQKAMITL